MNDENNGHFSDAWRDMPDGNGISDEFGPSATW